MTWLISSALLRDYESSRCSPEQVAAYLAGGCWDGKQFVLLSGSSTPQPFWHNDKPMDILSHSQFGVTFAPLTGDHGADLLTWFLAGSHVKTSAPQEKAQACPVRAAVSGTRWRELLLKWNPDSCGWRTRPSLFPKDSTSSYLTLPRWGSMRNGALWERVTSRRTTSETGSGSLPTPVKYDSHGTWASNNYHGLGWLARHEWSLQQPAATQEEYSQRWKSDGLWPTPTKGDAGIPLKLRRPWKEGDNQPHLQQVIYDRLATQYPTPMKGNGLRGGAGSEHQPLQWMHRGHPDWGWLNADWEEVLMGWVSGWTNLDPLPASEFEDWYRGFMTGQSTRYGIQAWETGQWEADLSRTTTDDTLLSERVGAIGNGQVPAALVGAWNLLTEQALIPTGAHTYDHDD